MKVKSKNKIKVVVLSGGISSEREVSLASGRNVVKALRSGENKERYSVIPVIVHDPRKLLSKLQSIKPDVIFPVLHGTFGEDGTLQALLEVFGKPYVGSRVLASAMCMDKLLSSGLVATKGLNMPRYLGVGSLSKLNYPCVVKPRSSGSSVGVSIVKNKEGLKRALSLANRESEAIIQEYIRGREFTCVVIELKKGKPTVLSVIEIVSPKGFYDYKAKYAKGGSEHIMPARISASLTRKIQEAALLAHKTLGCRHISRSDFIIKGTKIYYLETNTCPGMTGTSTVPQAAKLAGLSMPKLCHEILQATLNGSN